MEASTKNVPKVKGDVIPCQHLALSSLYPLAVSSATVTVPFPRGCRLGLSFIVPPFAFISENKDRTRFSSRYEIEIPPLRCSSQALLDLFRSLGWPVISVIGACERNGEDRPVCARLASFLRFLFEAGRNRPYVSCFPVARVRRDECKNETRPSSFILAFDLVRWPRFFLSFFFFHEHFWQVSSRARWNL